MLAERANPSGRDFIICYAADPDLAAGVSAMADLFPSLAAYRSHMESLLRDIADDNLAPEEVVRAYHGALQASGIKPKRSLQDDLLVVTPELKG